MSCVDELAVTQFCSSCEVSTTIEEGHNNFQTFTSSASLLFSMTTHGLTFECFYMVGGQLTAVLAMPNTYLPPQAKVCTHGHPLSSFSFALTGMWLAATATSFDTAVSWY